MSVVIEPITPHLGAEVRGINLGEMRTEETESIRTAFKEHLVLVFRDQALTRDQHKAFGRRFGARQKLRPHPQHRRPLLRKVDWRFMQYRLAWYRSMAVWWVQAAPSMWILVGMNK